MKRKGLIICHITLSRIMDSSSYISWLSSHHSDDLSLLESNERSSRHGSSGIQPNSHISFNERVDIERPNSLEPLLDALNAIKSQMNDMGRDQIMTHRNLAVLQDPQPQNSHIEDKVKHIESLSQRIVQQSQHRSSTHTISTRNSSSSNPNIFDRVHQRRRSTHRNLPEQHHVFRSVRHDGVNASPEGSCSPSALAAPADLPPAIVPLTMPDLSGRNVHPSLDSIPLVNIASDRNERVSNPERLSDPDDSEDSDTTSDESEDNTRAFLPPVNPPPVQLPPSNYPTRPDPPLPIEHVPAETTASNLTFFPCFIVYP